VAQFCRNRRHDRQFVLKLISDLFGRCRSRLSIPKKLRKPLKVLDSALGRCNDIDYVADEIL
jgi:hypothetical protein